MLGVSGTNFTLIVKSYAAALPTFISRKLIKHILFSNFPNSSYRFQFDIECRHNKLNSFLLAVNPVFMGSVNS